MLFIRDEAKNMHDSLFASENHYDGGIIKFMATLD